MVRALTLITLAVLLTTLVGCGRNQQAEDVRVAEAAPSPAVAPSPGPRVNLYPLSAPPPGSLQPLMGAAPPVGYAQAPTYAATPQPVASPYQNVAYQSPYRTTVQTTTYQQPAPTFPAPYTGMTTASGYCAVEDITSTSSPYVPMVDPPIVVDNQYYPSTGGMVREQTTTASYSYTAPAPVTTPAAYSPASAAYTTTTAAYTPAPAAMNPVTTTTYTASAAPLSAAAPAATSYRLVPALDIPPGIHPNDAAPSQWFEIVRPGNGPVRIGRVSSTCVCVGVRVPNRHVAAGERALIEARVVSRPPVNNLTYGMYVNVLEPENVMLDTDVTIRL